MTPEHLTLMAINAIAFMCLAVVLIIAQSLRLHGFKPYDGLTLMYDRAKQILNKIWGMIPYRGQSVIIIGIWIFIPAVFISDLVIPFDSLALTDIPGIFLAVCFTGLGIFYIVEELRGKLRGKPNV